MFMKEKNLEQSLPPCFLSQPLNLEATVSCICLPIRKYLYPKISTCMRRIWSFANSYGVEMKTSLKSLITKEWFFCKGRGRRWQLLEQQDNRLRLLPIAVLARSWQEQPLSIVPQGGTAASFGSLNFRAFP